MKVILLKDVAKLGKKSEVKEVESGFALNFLIPRKLAVIATVESMKRHTEEVRQHTTHKEFSKKLFMDACAVLKDKIVSYPVEANEKGHLFKGINAQDIALKLEAAHITISIQSILLKQPIKSLGLHSIQLVQDGVTGVCQLEIVKK